jgi:Ca2+-binding EF-hand superfamily protein
MPLTLQQINILKRLQTYGLVARFQGYDTDGDGFVNKGEIISFLQNEGIEFNLALTIDVLQTS